jgi:hypothetical protein
MAGLSMAFLVAVMTQMAIPEHETIISKCLNKRRKPENA